MNGLEAAVLEIAEYLDTHRVPYMVIGGFANLHWGRPRLTEDIDVTVQVPEESWPDFIAHLGERFRARPGNPLEFARQTRVLPLMTTSGVRVDLIFAGLAYEDAAIHRAIELPLGAKKVRLCTAEDLILHKLTSDRQRDLDDVEGVIVRQGDKLDRRYLDPLVQELATALEKPEIESFYRTCLKKAGAEPGGA